MNKFVKGSVAAGAGIVLLLGGAGTFALWNDSTEISDATIESGVLTIAETGSGAWTEDYDKWVPGDEDTYETELTVTAVGDTIKGELAVDEGSFSTTSDLADSLEVTYEVDLSAVSGVTYDAVADVYEFEEGTFVLPVAVRVVFDPSVTDDFGQDDSVTIEDIGFTITQVI